MLTHKLAHTSWSKAPLYNVNVKCNIRLILLMFMKMIKKRLNENN